MSSKTWQVQTAKQRFSELVRAAETGSPQFISRHGRQVAVVMDIVTYQAAQDDKPSFLDFLRSGPGMDDLEIPERVIETERDIGL